MTANAASDSPKNARKRRVHKRTILFVALLVLLPWTLLSVPGDSVGGGGTTGLNVSHCQHGWPFVHMHSTHYDLYGNWVNGTFVRGKPANINPKPHAVDWFNRFFHSPERSAKFLEFDLRLTKSKWGTFGYWSNTENWTFWDDEHHYEIRWIGLLVNLLLLSVAAVIVGWPIEKKIRNGTLFKFSLFSLGVMIALLCVVLTVGVRSYRIFQSEQRYLKGLSQLENENLLWLEVEYTERFPRVVSQLLDGGYSPWGEQQITRMVSEATIHIDVDDCDDEQMERILNVLEQGNFGLAISALEYSPRTERYLKTLDAHKIVSLDLSYEAYDWFSEQTGQDFYDMSREEALKKQAIAVNLDLKLPYIEDLTVELHEFFTVREQLEPFLDLPSRTRIQIRDMDDDAAKFALETQDRWPDFPYFSWSEGELDPELSEKMRQRFPPPEESGGVF
jgi:hypothetical protein